MSRVGITLFRRSLLGHRAPLRKVLFPISLCHHQPNRDYSSENEKGTLIPLPEVKRFIVDCMRKVGTNQKYALELADVLIAADYRGHYSHGLNRLGEIE